MRDLNFFINPRAHKKQAPFVKVFLISLAVVLVLLAGVTYYLFDQSQQARSTIRDLESKLADAKIVAARAELDQVNQKIAIIKHYDQSLNDIEEYLATKSQISRQTIDLITSAIPKTITYNMTSLTNTELYLEVLSVDDQAKAQLVHNLKTTELFSSVELQTASLNEEDGAGPSDRILTVYCVFKEVQTK